MEEVLIILIQFLVEFTLNVLGSLPFDWPSKNRTTPEPESIVGYCALWLFGGCLLAALSLLLFKHTIISVSALRIVNLFLAPVTSAFLSQAIASRRAKSNKFIIPRYHFWRAFWFTLGLTLIRFGYASRA